MATELGVCGAPGSGAPNWTQYEPNAPGHRPDHPSDGPQCQGPPGRLPQEAGKLTRRCAGSSPEQGTNMPLCEPKPAGHRPHHPPERQVCQGSTPRVPQDSTAIAAMAQGSCSGSGTGPDPRKQIATNPARVGCH